MSSIKLIIKILWYFANHLFLISQFSQTLDERTDSSREPGDGSKWLQPNYTQKFQNIFFFF